MATHLLDLALQQEVARRTAASAAQVALASAGGAARAAEVARVAAALALDLAEAALAALRRERPQTPAAVAALAIALRQATVAQRQALATLLTRGAAAGSASATQAAARQAAVDAAEAHTQSRAGLALARAAHERRRALIDDALTQPPLSSVAADAAAVAAGLAGSDFALARARIDGALPPALRGRARSRATQALALVPARAARRAAAQAAVDAVAEAGGQPASPLPRLRRALAAADAALTGYAGGAIARLDGARATLARSAALQGNPLTAAQHTQLQRLQAGARPAAAAAEQARDEAALALTGAAAALRGERIRTRINHPAGDMAAMESDAAAHPTLAQARTDFDAAEAAHAAAEAAYTTGMRHTLADWQAEVPEPLWSEAAAFWAAADTLQALQVAPAALVAATAAAEAALLTALEADAPVQQRSVDAAAALAAEVALEQSFAPALPAQSAAALRGPLVSAPWLLP